MNTALKETFLILKPICDQVAVRPDERSLSALKDVASRVSPECLQELQEYVFFPLELHLMNPANSRKEILIHIVNCLRALLHLTVIKTLKHFLKLYWQLFPLITGVETPDIRKDAPEELKLGVIECVTELFLKAEYGVLIELYSRSHYPRLCLGVYTCCQIVKEEKFHTLRISSLNCLLVMTGTHLEGKLREKCSNIVMLMLPGVINACLSTAISSVTQNHEVTLMALRLWSKILVLVMDDKLEVEKQDAELIPYNSSSNLKDNVLRAKESEKRTATWIKSAAEKLSSISENIVSTQSHSHWKVRHELAVGCDLIISKCLRNMEPSIMFLVNALIVLSQDENERIVLTAKNALNAFSERCDTDSGKTLVENVEETFFNLVTRLPRVINGTDECKQLSELSLLAGYLSILGPSRLPHMLNSSSHLEKLIFALIHVMELDILQAQITEEEFIVKDYNDYQSWCKKSKSWKALRHFNSDCLVKKLEEICFILSESCGQFLSHYLLDLYGTNPVHRKEVTYILNLIVISYLKKSKDVQLMNAILDTYLDPDFWYLCVSKNDRAEGVFENGVRASDLSLSEIRSNVVQICLMIEGIGDIALAVGGDLFSPSLLNCLYFLLERAGSSLEMISEAGLFTLGNITKACGLADLTTLIDLYSDYLIHHVSIRLKNVNRYPQVLNVFIVIISKCTIHALPSLQEIINNVLMYSCDMFQDRSLVSFLHVFLTFVAYAQKWMTFQPKLDSYEAICERRTTFNPVKNSVEYVEMLKNANSFEDKDQDSYVSSNPENDLNELENEDFDETLDEKKKELPETIKITVSILTRALNFLPHKDESVQLLVLQILERGINVLQDEEEVLLPIAHKIWEPLVARFKSSKPLIMHHSFNLLSSLAKFTKDFIRSRTMKEVLPILFLFLEDSAKSSRLKDVGSAYRMTQLYKLQLALLTGLGSLLLNLDCLERPINDTLNAVKLYLSSYQPIPLQQSSVELFKVVAMGGFAELAWTVLLSVSSKLFLVPPNSNFPPYEVASLPPGNEYEKNVKPLMEFLLNIN